MYFIFMLSFLFTNDKFTYKKIENATVTVKLIKSPSGMDNIDGYGVYSEMITIEGREYSLLDSEILYESIENCNNLNAYAMLYRKHFHRHREDDYSSDRKYNFVEIYLSDIDRRLFIGSFYSKTNNTDTLYFIFKSNCYAFLIEDDFNDADCGKGYLNPMISFFGKKTDYIIPEIESRRLPLASIIEIDTTFALNDFELSEKKLFKSNIRSVIVKSAWKH